MSLADMAAILRLAAERDCKVVITGDHEQLAAVEGGGGMMLLARRQGYVQLAEPQRFTHDWERDATLRLRAGDVTVLAAVRRARPAARRHPEEAVEQAYRGWLADHLDGKDTLLMARTEEQARELSRRARDDLIRYGLVLPAPTSASRRASSQPGDLIMARRNTRTIQAGAGRPGADQPRRPADHTATGRADGRRAPADRPRPGHRPGRLVGAVPVAAHATSRSTATWPTRPPGTPRRAAPPTPPTSWSTGSATGRDCTSP